MAGLPGRVQLLKVAVLLGALALTDATIRSDSLLPTPVVLPLPSAVFVVAEPALEVQFVDEKSVTW